MSNPLISSRAELLATRRTILGWSASGIAATLLAPSFMVANEQTDKRAPDDDFCTLGFSTYGMKTMETAEALKVLAEIGFDSAEIAIGVGWDADSAKLEPARRRSLRALLDDLPLRLTSLMEHLPPTDAAQQAVALTRLKKAAELAHDLAIGSPPLIQTVLGGGRWEESKTQLRDRLGEWVKIADATDTTIAIKPHRGGAVSQPADAVWLIEQLGKPRRLRMVYDYSHYAYRDLPIDETIRTALPYAEHVVVKDAVKQKGEVVFKLPGEAGTIDFASIIKQFHAGRYRRDVNCEVSGMVSSQANYDPLAAARTCYKHLAKSFAEAKVPRPKR